MIGMAVRSLRKDLDRAIFYWIVFLISSFFMYTFFHLSLSEEIGVTFIYSENTLPIYLTVFNVLVCIIVIFLANDFFVKKKSQELAVLLVCGSTYYQLVKFLFLQTGLLLITAVPTGILLGKAFFPVLELAMSLIAGSKITITSTGEAEVATALIVFFEVFWCTIVNLGYSYRNTVYSLLHGEQPVKIRFGRGARKNPGKYLYPVLYIACACLLYQCGQNTQLMLILGVLGMVGLNGSIHHALYPYLERAIRERWSEDEQKAVYLGFFRSDLKVVEVYIFLFIATAIILVTTIASQVQNTAEMTLCLLSFIMLLPLLAMSLMFRFTTETVERQKSFYVLEKLGYLKKQLYSIMKKELLCLYGFIAGTSLFYILNCIVALSFHQLLPTVAVMLILVFFLIPLVICGLVSYRYYRRLLG